jgi:hypothetical protein
MQIREGRMKLDQFVMSAMSELFKPEATTFKGQDNVPGWTRVPSKSELDNYFKTSLAGPAFDPTVHWCGIFATYLLKKAGVRCHWAMGDGITDDSNGQDLETTDSPNAQKDLQIGDVVVREPQHHHIIVLEPVDAGTIRCVEGNAGGVGKPLLAMHWAANMRNNTVGNIVKRYRIKERMSWAGLVRS